MDNIEHQKNAFYLFLRPLNDPHRGTPPRGQRWKLGILPGQVSSASFSHLAKKRPARQGFEGVIGKTKMEKPTRAMKVNEAKARHREPLLAVAPT